MLPYLIQMSLFIKVMTEMHEWTENWDFTTGESVTIFLLITACYHILICVTEFAVRHTFHTSSKSIITGTASPQPLNLLQ